MRRLRRTRCALHRPRDLLQLQRGHPHDRRRDRQGQPGRAVPRWLQLSGLQSPGLAHRRPRLLPDGRRARRAEERGQDHDADLGRVRPDGTEQFSRFVNDTTAIDHNLYGDGNRVYQSNYRSGLRILNSSGVADGQLREVGWFDTWPEDDATAFSHGTWSNYPYFDNGVVIVHGYDGLFVLRPTGSAR